MSRTLCTFPGRYGDILWALPSIRSLSEAIGSPVDLCIAGEFASMVPLLEQQPYLGSVAADPDWSLDRDSWHWPKLDTEGDRWQRVYELGYRRWPESPLPEEVFETLHTGLMAPFVPLDLTRPWITVEGAFLHGPEIACGWSDCHFELKYGLMKLLENQQQFGLVLCPRGSRWQTEAEGLPTTWEMAAQYIGGTDLFFGDCSALHVLAVALGKPVVLMEPMEARWNAIFYPLGKEGRVRLVTGHDGRPTFDARHVADALKEALAHAR